MQTPLNLSIPDHDFHYLDNGIYSVKWIKMELEDLNKEILKLLEE